MSRLTAKVLLLTALAVSGCGTMGNLQDRDKVYGGVRLDGKEAWRAGKELLHPPDPSKTTIKEDAAILVFASLDTPLSVFADTLTLPITIPLSVRHWLKGDGPPPESPAAPLQVQALAEPPLASAAPAAK